jgi:hypothetical protein
MMNTDSDFRVLDFSQSHPQNSANIEALRKGVTSMRQKILSRFLATFLLLSIIAAPGIGIAEDAPARSEEGHFVLGSVLLSILYLPVKLVTCVGTQAGAGVAYVATYGVPGGYDGGTNGRDIGEVARKSCTGDWIITPQQVKKDYGS